ncbi:beta strand repeat-containing protein [Sporocytophaga myxococcoides]|uniref:beta strand repeat-containing protein n=1 Tax=Sporocytophaga myxococcoides TaxID=153721 RepID=UPI000402A085|nr:gliding motility-associated C-terminal domain-containing protein [Sporocytophaga myxococcoides]
MYNLNRLSFICNSKKLTFRIVTLLFLLTVWTGAYADSFTWKANSVNKDWENPANWNATNPINAQVPVDANNKVVFRSTDNITIVTSTNNNAPELNSNQTIGTFTVTLGILTINGGFSLNVTSTVSISGGATINGQGQLNINQASSLGTTIGSDESGATINCSVNAIVGALILKKSTFGSNTSTYFKITTGGANYGIGGNEFNGVTTFEAAGPTGLRLSDLGEDKFNNDLTLISTTGLIYVSYNFNTKYYGNIVVKSSGSGIYFGNNVTKTPTSELVSSKTITAQGFTAGTLTLNNFIQSGTTTPQIITLGGTTSTLVFISTPLNSNPQTIFESDITVSAPTITLSGGWFKKEATFNIAGGTGSTGGNRYDGVTKFNYTGASSNSNFSLDGDHYYGKVTFINSGLGTLRIGNIGTVNFESDVKFENILTGSIVLANTATSIVNFNSSEAKVVFVNGASGAYIFMSYDGITNFYSDVEVNSLTNSSIYSANNGTVNLKAETTIKVGDVGFTNGTLLLRNFKQLGGTEQVLSFNSSGSAILNLNRGCDFSGNLTVIVPKLFLQGGTFQKVTDFTMCSNDEPASNLNSTNLEPINFVGDSYIRNTGKSHLNLGCGAPLMTFGANTSFFISGTGSINICYLPNSSTLFAAADKKLSVNISSVNHAAAGSLTLGTNGIVTINSNVELYNNAIAGITFGGSATGSAINGTITTTENTFSYGNLFFRNIVQMGESPQNLILGESTVAAFNSGTVFNGILNVKASHVQLNGGTFNGVSTFEKTGNSNTASGGSNLFKDVTFINRGQGYFLMGNTSADYYSGNVTYENTSSGGFYVSWSGNNYFDGNIQCKNSGSGAVSFGGTGTSFLKEGKIISASAFTSGSLVFNNFIQKGNTLQNLELTGSSVVSFNKSTFNGEVICLTPRLSVTGSVFEMLFTGIKTGNFNDTWTGGNNFKLGLTFTNNSTGSVTLANTNGDIYGGDVILNKNSSGGIVPSKNGVNEYYGSITYDVGVSGSVPDIFGYGGTGITVFKGNNSQTVSSNYGTLAFWNGVKIDKESNHVTLNTIFQTSCPITFVKGNFVTTPNFYFRINNPVTISGASYQSFIDGKIRRYGAGVFTFPVGKNGKYRPVTISDPVTVVSDIYLEYFNESPSGSTFTSPLMDVSECEYWNINTITPIGNYTPYAISLGWDSDACTPINPNVISVARYVSGAWKSEGNNNVTANYDIGTVTSNVANFLGNYNFTLGYRSKAFINTYNVNSAIYKVTAGAEKFKIPYFTSGFNGTNNGVVKIHPDLNSTSVLVDIDEGTTNASYNLKLETNGTSNFTKVSGKKNGTFYSLSDKLYTINNNTITFYKDGTPSNESELIVLTNLEGGLVFKPSNPAPNNVFKITVPNFSNTKLEVINASGTTVYPESTLLQWDGKDTNGDACVNGTYRFNININGTVVYQGQLILKRM